MTDERETQEVLRRYAAAWQANDVEALLASYADDVVFHYSGTTDLAGVHSGKDAAVAAMVEASTRAKRELLEVIDVLAGDVLGAIVFRERFSRDGESVDMRRTGVYRIERGRVAEMWMLDEDQALIDRFWRS